LKLFRELSQLNQKYKLNAQMNCETDLEQPLDFATVYLKRIENLLKNDLTDQIKKSVGSSNKSYKSEII